MRAAVLTEERLRAQVAALLARKPDAATIGVRTAAAWPGPNAVMIDGMRFTVATCRSELEMRYHLAAAEQTGNRQILLTPLADTELAADVLARLPRRRLLQVQPWLLVQEMFQAKRIDARILGQPWVADMLIDLTPPTGYAPVAAGMLDQDTAWGILLDRALGIGTDRPDARELLRWSLDSGQLERYASQPESFRRGLRGRLEETAGAVGLAILDAVEAGHGGDIFAIGVACEVLCAPGAAREKALWQAAARLEPFLGARPLTDDVARDWARATAEIVRSAAGGPRSLRAALDRADQLLETLQAAPWAHLSRLSRGGFRARLERFARSLDQALEAIANPGAQGLAGDDPKAAAEAIRDHALAVENAGAIERVTMAGRLLRYAQTCPGTCATGKLGDAIAAYVTEGAFVDWARGWLRGGDPIASLSKAYEGLLRKVWEIREEQNKRFGELLVAWSAARGVADERFVLIEEVLERVVCPLAEAAPAVLLLVVDGLSGAIFYELFESLLEDGWQPVCRATLPGDIGACVPVLTAVPSVTQVCRTSLLSGALTSGDRSAEKRAFGAHPALRAQSKADRPPVVFHKGDLEEPGGTDLASQVRDSLEDLDQKVVAIVLNAVDDHLVEDDQIRPRWTVDYMRFLAAILEEAHASGRAVVITSDHGHVVEAGTRQRDVGEAGDRWRQGDAADLVPGELAFAGGRVGAPGGRIITTWSEGVRYGAKKNGYHGGVSPQEMIAPLCMLLPHGTVLDGWREIAPKYPAWWFEEELPRPGGAMQRQRPERPKAAKRPPRSTQQTPLFGAGKPQAAAARKERDWIDALLASPLFGEQLQTAGRLAPKPEQIRAFLAAMQARGNTLTRTAIIQQVGIMPLRLQGFLAGMTRVLNVEGYAVLFVDEAAGSVTLNRSLLAYQFDLGKIGWAP
ncbi:MAG: BREX-2 system phosphatase PglZ [Candidatus Schekmanbacteria bacterium]|nr:BREX-2 system phosphatase PglZ [Candidatus Schekmanbacteria bacterium]